MGLPHLSSTFPRGLRVTPIHLLGASLGFSATVPRGYLDIDAKVSNLRFGDQVFTVGNPSLAAFLGWYAGKHTHPNRNYRLSPRPLLRVDQ
jgi:hypothetical protein